MFPFRHILILFILLLTYNILAHPINHNDNAKPPKVLKPKKLIDQSKISTQCNKIGVWPWYNKYEILATNWNLSEQEIQSVVSKAGAMTGWKYKEWGTSPEGIKNAMINFNLDVARSSRLEKSLSKALGLDPEAENAVKCRPSGAGTKV